MGTKELERFIDNKSLVALRKFAKAEAQLKTLKEQHDAVVEQIREAMVAAGVQRIEGEWGYITLAERTTYKADDIDSIDEKYLKPALDTTKVKAQHTLTGQLPVGVVETKTQYITKRLLDV
jgi:hypothetical protein